MRSAGAAASGVGPLGRKVSDTFSCPAHGWPICRNRRKRGRAAIGQKTLRVELHPVQWVCLVPYPHDFPRSVRRIAPGANLELFAERVGLDHETVISGSLERVFQALVQPPLVVINHVGLAVHQPAGTDDGGPKRLANRLVPKTYPQ